MTTTQTCRDCHEEIGGGVVKKLIDGRCGFCHRQREVARIVRKTCANGHRLNTCDEHQGQFWCDGESTSDEGCRYCETCAAMWSA